MDNAQKAIMIGVGLFITIIVIAAVMLITGIGQDLLNSGTQKASSISENLQAQLTSQYDGTTMTGSQVVSAIKSNYKTSGMVIILNNTTTVGDTASDVNYGSSKLTKDATAIEANTTPEVGPLSDPSATSYVNPTAKYRATLVKIGDTVVGMRFDRQ